MTTVATTLDGAVMTVDASSGVPSTAVYQSGIATRQDGALYVAAIGGNAFDPRTLLIGDSHLAMGTVYTTNQPSSFTVAAGVATITFAGSSNFMAGNKTTFFETSQIGVTYDTTPMSYYQFVPLTVPNNNTATFSAVVNGQTVPDGDYGTGKTWTFLHQILGRDSALLNWINQVAGYPLTYVHNFTQTGSFSAAHLAAISKLQGQCPKSSYSNVVISLGTNSSMLQQATLTTAIAAAETEYRNIMKIADTLYSNGTVYIIIPLPAASGFSNQANYTRAMGYFRRKLLRTVRGYRIKFIDMLGMGIDGTSASGLEIATYNPAGTNNHLSTYGCFRVAKQLASWMQRQTFDQWSTALYKPVSILDDSTNLPLAWTTSQTWTAGTIRAVNHQIYYCTQGGAGATSGTGPSGTGTGIADGAALWDYAGPAAVNLALNGMMTGTAGTNTAGFASGTPTVPTSWNIFSASNVTLASCASTAQAAITVLPAGSDAIPGYGWNLSIVYTGVGTVTLQQSQTLRPQPSTWYQARFTVTGLTSLNTVLAVVGLRIQPTGVSPGFFGPQAMASGNNTTTIPLDVTDTYEVVTPPFFIPANSGAPSENQCWIDITSSGAGTVNLQISNFAYYPVRDPSLPPAVV